MVSGTRVWRSRRGDRRSVLGRSILGLAAGFLAALALAWPAFAAPAATPQGKPIVIGFSMALTGGLAANGKMALLGMQIWAEDINKKGGLLGRRVKLDYYDDQSNPALVPGIYTKLLDIDKVDFVVSGYATNITGPAMPIVMQHHMVFISLFALDANAEFNYPDYFAMIPTGPDTRPAISAGFFELVKAEQAKLGLKTIAFVADDGEATRNADDGAHTNVKTMGLGLKTVYDRTYPPTTTDFTPIIRAIQAAKPDVVFVASYPPDSVGILRSVHEIGLDTKIFGGSVTGPQTTSVKTLLGPLLNGTITFDWWLPAPKLQFPGVMSFLARYQVRAKKAGIDPLGYYLAPWSYSDLEILGDAVAATKSLDQQKVADYIRTHTFKTLVGDVTFGKKGEWKTPRVMTVQFQNITGNAIGDFVDGKGEVIIGPAQYKSGEPILPYSDIKH